MSSIVFSFLLYFVFLKGLKIIDPSSLRQLTFLVTRLHSKRDYPCNLKRQRFFRPLFFTSCLNAFQRETRRDPPWALINTPTTKQSSHPSPSAPSRLSRLNCKVHIDPSACHCPVWPLLKAPRPSADVGRILTNTNSTAWVRAVKLKSFLWRSCKRFIRNPAAWRVSCRDNRLYCPRTPKKRSRC